MFVNTHLQGSTLGDLTIVYCTGDIHVVCYSTFLLKRDVNILNPAIDIPFRKGLDLRIPRLHNSQPIRGHERHRHP